MESKKIEDSLKETLVGFQHYIDLQIRYNKLLLSKRMGEISSYLVLFLLILGLFGFAVFFLAFAFVEWYADAFGSRLQGRLIVSGIFILLAILIILFKEVILFGPIRKLFGKIFTAEDGYVENIHVYDSRESINLRLKTYREIISDEEESLKENLHGLGEVFTLTNIVQSAGRSIYNTFLTTSNIASAAYNLVRRLKGSSSKKKKKGKNKPPQLEDDND